MQGIRFLRQPSSEPNDLADKTAGTGTEQEGREEGTEEDRLLDSPQWRDSLSQTTFTLKQNSNPRHDHRTFAERANPEEEAERGQSVSQRRASEQVRG
jgi:hypothetical protein